MKKLILALFVCLAAVTLVAPAFATELWDPHLRGIDEGLAAGALPPPGLYFINNSYFTPDWHFYGSSTGAPLAPQNHSNPDFKLNAYVDVPILLWVPGCKFLGADYGMAIAQPFDYTNLRLGSGVTGLPAPLLVGGAQWGTFNTILVPYILSWKLPCDFRVKTGLAVALADAMSSPGNEPDNTTDYAASGNGYYSFTPSVGISWLHAGWNVSGEFFYSFNTKNNDTGYTSGQQFAADYTITYTCGKWTFGGGFTQGNGVTGDTYADGSNVPNSRASFYAGGPIVGYNFGPCSLMFWYNFPFATNNDVGGENFNLRLVVPLWK